MSIARFLFAIVPIAMTVAISGCAVEPQSDEPTGESQDHLLAGRRIPTSEVAGLLRQAGFPESMIGKMVCTAKYESSFYERASNKNRNGSTDYGLFQINSVHLGDAGCPSSPSGLYDAAANARCAYRVYRQQGINAWYGYQKHRSECDRTAAPNGLAAPQGGATDTNDDGGGGCWSGTLEEMTPANTCVQSKFDDVWYQCHDGKWYRGVSGNGGPYGACSSKHAL